MSTSLGNGICRTNVYWMHVGGHRESDGDLLNTTDYVTVTIHQQYDITWNIIKNNIKIKNSWKTPISSAIDLEWLYLTVGRYIVNVIEQRHWPISIPTLLFKGRKECVGYQGEGSRSSSRRVLNMPHPTWFCSKGFPGVSKGRNSDNIDRESSITVCTLHDFYGIS